MTATVFTDTIFVQTRELEVCRRRIVSLIDLLLGVMTINNRKGDRIIRSIFEEIILSLRKQFILEEKMMDELEYPDIAIHMGEHFWISQYLDDYADEFNKGRSPMLAFFPMTLKSRVVNHFNLMDNCFGQYQSRRQQSGTEKTVPSSQCNSFVQAAAADFIAADRSLCSEW